MTIDRSSNIFETYFFSKIGLENLTATQLFDMVKSGHLQYDHDDSIQFAVRSVKDDVGNIFWAVEVLIANSIKLIRKRPPFFEFYEGVDVPQAFRWSALKGYMDAQRNGIPFLLIEGETGSPTWKDSDTHRIVPIGSEAALIEKLKEKPTTLPITDYTSHNLGVIDARDLSRPFNHTTYHPAKHWPV
ncbi:hypothetical protein [Hyphococcus lacteus]|uniref:Uncharacterized protein n=1 Tax=Hyphococcus lacteus TaxID=3143536 RepID=A0ABV3Z7J9_9PROT